MKKIKFLRFGVFLRGIAMGIADIIPGVSGGTIALITGIYRELLNTLNLIDLNFFQTIVKFQFKKIDSKYNVNFLLSLILGITFSLVVFSQILLFLLNNFSTPLWSFFFGLIVSSIFFLLKKIKRWEFIIYFFLMLGLVLGLFLQNLNPGNFEITYVFLFLCGMLSITAMLLPGISGAYILILLGAYETMIITLTEVVKFNSDYFLNLFSFISGALVSVKLFSKFLSWTFKKYTNETFSCLTGFMMGSIPSLWPLRDENSNLKSFSEFNTNHDFFDGLISVIVFIFLGILLVFILEYISKKNGK